MEEAAMAVAIEDATRLTSTEIPAAPPSERPGDVVASAA
jgi:hypothetical protein